MAWPRSPTGERCQTLNSGVMFRACNATSHFAANSKEVRATYTWMRSRTAKYGCAASQAR